MDQQPLLYLSPSNQLKHVMCLLTLLSSLERTEQVCSVLDIGLNQLLLSYSSPQSRHLSQHISPVFVLKWLASDVHKQVSNTLLVVSFTSCRVYYRNKITDDLDWICCVVLSVVVENVIGISAHQEFMWMSAPTVQYRIQTDMLLGSSTRFTKCFDERGKFTFDTRWVYG